MGPQVTNNYGTILIVQTIFTMLFLFPGFSLFLWKSLARKWTLTVEKKMIKRTRTAEDKLKKYWEIDMRKFK